MEKRVQKSSAYRKQLGRSVAPKSGILQPEDELTKGQHEADNAWSLEAVPDALNDMPMTPKNVLSLQRAVGNRAASKLLQTRRENGAAPSVQREGEEEDPNLLEDDNENAMLQAKRVDGVIQREGEEEDPNLLEDDNTNAMVQAKRMESANAGGSAKIQRNPLAALKAAEWIAVGAIGYDLTQNAVNETAGDITYSFDEMEGVLLPGGGGNVEDYRTKHPDAKIRTHTFMVDAWQGTEGSKKMGIRFGITFNFDGHALGNISCRIIDTYDWPMWEGSINVNLTPETLANGDVSRVRITINGNADRTFAGGRARSAILMLDASGVIQKTEGALYVRFPSG